LRVLPQIGNPVFLLCDFWAIWVQLVFGLWLFSCTFIFRLWRLFVIVKLKRSAQSYRFYLSFFIFWGPALIYGIFASAFKVDGPVDYQGYFQCRFLGAAKYVVFVLTGIYILVILVLFKFFFYLFSFDILVLNFDIFLSFSFLKKKNSFLLLLFDQFHKNI